MATITEVARHAGVGAATVSRVLNGSPLVREDTRERVLAAINEMGYRRNNAARVLATNRSGRIGMVSAHLALYGPSMVVDAVHGAAHQAGYDVSMVGLEELSAESLRGAVDRLLDQAVEAMVIAVAHRDALESARSLDLSIPVVLAQGVMENEPMAAGIDQVAGAELATTHLLDLGHERIAHITGPLVWVEAEMRRHGWRAAHRARGVEPGPELVGDWSAQSGYDAGRRIAADPDITAVFTANDAMALGLLRALHEAGRRVPDEVSVVGFDGIPDGAFYWPGLTTVNQDFADLGRRAVDLAVRALGGEATPGAGLVMPTLVRRDSTASR